MKKSFACRKRRGHTPPDTTGFSIPLRSDSHLNLLYVGQVEGLGFYSLRSFPLPGFGFLGYLMMIRAVFPVFLRLFLKGFWFDYAHHKAKLRWTEESCGRK